MKKLKYFLLLVVIMGLLVAACNNRISYPKNQTTTVYVEKILLPPAEKQEIIPGGELFVSIPWSADGAEDEIEGRRFFCFDGKFSRQLRKMHKDTMAKVWLTYLPPVESLSRGTYDALPETVKAKIPYEAWKLLAKEGIYVLENAIFLSRCGEMPCPGQNTQPVPTVTPKVIPMPR